MQVPTREARGWRARIRVPEEHSVLKKDQKKHIWRRIECDKVIVVGSNEFPVNSTVLGTQSSFFESIFAKSKATLVSLNHPQINPNGFTLWLEEINSPGSVEFTTKNIIDVWKVAYTTRSQWVLRRCKTTVADLLRSSANDPSMKEFGIMVYSCACLFSDTNLENRTREFITDNIAEALYNNEFQKAVDATKLLEILKMPHLTVTSEEKLFLAIMTWVNFDLSARKTFLADMLKCLYLHVIPAAILKNALYKDEFMKNEECLNVYMDAIHCHAIEEMKATRPRRPRYQRYSTAENRFLVTFKCESPMYYEQEEDKWHCLPMVEDPPGQIIKCTSTLSTITSLVKYTNPLDSSNRYEIWEYSCQQDEWRKLYNTPWSSVPDDLVCLQGTLYLMENRRMWKRGVGNWMECVRCTHNCTMSSSSGKYIIRFGRSNSKKTIYCSCYDVTKMEYVRIGYQMAKQPIIVQRGGLQSVMMIDGSGIYDWYKWIKYCIKNGESMDSESSADFLIPQETQDGISLPQSSGAILIKDKLHLAVGQTLFLLNTVYYNKSNVCKNINYIKDKVSILPGDKNIALVSLPRSAFMK
ncbi:kelch-like protein 2 [Anneissia japonica]|uniref:kelch-like protein 2 n=1 Tax=Anneissia japonica TaxID=1529436 RepID=UPI00142567AD|nr:kelch-like protein 2 [Anneissia japonica]XP_033119664.1 kelch-like protein 2 [Anneissia japonica]